MQRPVRAARLASRSPTVHSLVSENSLLSSWLRLLRPPCRRSPTLFKPIGEMEVDNRQGALQSKEARKAKHGRAVPPAGEHEQRRAREVPGRRLSLLLPPLLCSSVERLCSALPSSAFASLEPEADRRFVKLSILSGYFDFTSVRRDREVPLLLRGASCALCEVHKIMCLG